MPDNPEEVPGPSDEQVPYQPEQTIASVPEEVSVTPAPSERVEQPEGVQYPPMPEQYINMPEYRVDPYGVEPVTAPPTVAPVYEPPPGPQAYGYAPHTPGYPLPFVPSPSEPLPLGSALSELPYQYRKILFKPGVRSFFEEQGKAAWNIIWIQLIFLTVISVLVNLITLPSTFSDLQQSMNAANVPAGTFDFSSLSSPGFLTLVTILAAIMVPAAFFIESAIQFGLAKLFRGTGTFKQQVYSRLLYEVPLTLATSLLSFLSEVLTHLAGGSGSPGALGISLLFSTASFALSIYTIVLNVFSIMAVHRLSGGRATGVVLIPIGIALALAFFSLCALVFVIAANSGMH